jgi:broad specificity phosphatase PhoE
MTLYLVRHLPTAWTRAGLLQGNRDLPILEPSEVDRTAIEGARTQLRHAEPIRAVLVSRLRRSQQTARAYGYEAVQVEPLLDELDFGPYEGRPRSELERASGGVWRTDPASVRLGEPLANLETRVRSFCRNYGEGQYLIFGHGAWLRALIAITHHGTIRAMNTFYIHTNQMVQMRCQRSGPALPASVARPPTIVDGDQP